MKSLTNLALIGMLVLPAVALGAGTAAAPVVVPPENLQVEGIPEIPLSLTEQIGRYTDFRTARFMDWHPQRREMLILTRFADTLQLHSVNHPGAARKQLTFFRDKISRGMYLPPLESGAKGGAAQNVGDSILLLKDRGGDEFFQLYLQDLKTSTVELLSDGKSRNTEPAVSPSGRYLVYNSTRRNGTDTDFYLFDGPRPFRKGGDRLLAQVKGGGWSALAFSPDERSILVREEISINLSKLHLVDLATGKMTQVGPDKDPSKEPVSYRYGAFAADGKGIFVTTDRDSEFLRLVYVDLATFVHTPLSTAVRWNIEMFELSEDRRTICAVSNEDGVGVMRLYDARSRAELPKPKLPQGSVGGCAFHKNGQDIAVNLVSARSPMDVYVYSLADKRVERFTESEAAVSAAEINEPESIKWRSFDGKTITGFYYRPAAKFKGPRPVIVRIHGGPESQSKPDYLGSLNYFLMELGVGILFPNVRGSDGYGKTFLRLDNGEKREDSVKDIGALLNHLATARPDIDKNRVLIYGGSYGGYMTLAVSATYPEKIRCSVDIVGISNFVTFLERTESYRRDLRRVEYGDERDPKMREFLNRISPLSNAHKIKKPIFVVQGKNDPRVPLGEAEQIVKTLRTGQTPVWYLVARDEGHGFAKKRNSDYLFHAFVVFVQRYLLGV